MSKRDIYMCVYYVCICMYVYMCVYIYLYKIRFSVFLGVVGGIYVYVLYIKFVLCTKRETYS